jgi:phospholipase/lecithinase/hemolysin
MASSLFLVGEIGVNDYLVALGSNTTVREVRTFVPHIVTAVRSVLQQVIAAGARTVLVPGMIPLGCEPQLLALYKSKSGGYDPESGCITELNDLAELHNRALKGMLRELRRAHPGLVILYADLYSAVADIIVSPRKYGFRDKPLAACCGGRGAYNFNMTAFCGAAGAAACADPSEYVSWDGVHFTEAANRRIACATLRINSPTLLDPHPWTAEAMKRLGCA